MYSRKEPNQGNILISIFLNLLITIAEFIGGIFSNSLALISDAFHNLGDTLAIVFTYVALKVGKKASTGKNTFGFRRIEILAAFINASVLIGISVFLFYEAYKRFLTPQQINEGIMLSVAIIGLIGNLVSVLLLKKDSKHSLNVRSAYMHLLGDTLSSIGVIAGSLVIMFFGILWIDPLLTVLIGLFILREAIKIFWESVLILMEGAPKDIDVYLIRSEIEKHPAVQNAHHLHAWQLSDSENYFLCHVDLKENLSLMETDQIRLELEQLILRKFNIQNATIQMEFDSCKEKSPIVNGK
jgi:cobalt-zinc-cadmium efflux system protein